MEEIRGYQQAEEQHQVIKPAINNFILLINAFGYALAIYLVGAWMFLGLIVAIITFIFKSEGILIFLISGIVLFILILWISFMLQKATLKKTEYRFYTDRIEYFEGFLVKNRKTVTYEKISNIGQRKGIIEGWFGLGTIFIDTPGSSPKGHEVTIPYLENPDQVYDWISKVISKKASV